MNDLPLEDFRWLISRAASPYLEQARESGAKLVQLAAGLRKELSASRAHLVLEQQALRVRARDKFSRADAMFFTRTLLEQATDEPIASYKAGRLTKGLRLIDLCCGLGGDLLGWATRLDCAGVDRNPVAALLAEANCRVYEHSAVGLIVAEAADCDVGGWDVWHIDPDRRSAGRRTTQLAHVEPDRHTLEKLLARNPRAAWKLAPATSLPPAWSERCEREWIGSRRECRQQVAWFDQLAPQPGLHRATVIDRRGQPFSVSGPGNVPIPVTTQLRRCILDPHPVVTAAALTGALCERHGWLAAGSPIGYLTTDQPLIDPSVAAFEVAAVFPLDRKQLRAALRQRRAGRLEIKVRGVDLDPARLLRELKPEGDEELTLLVMGPRSHIQVALARRLTPYE